MDNKDINSDDLRSDIRGGRVELKTKYDDKYTYQDIVEKDVLELMGFSTELTQEKKDALHQKIEETLETRVAGRILDLLNEADRNSYDKLLIEENNQEAYDFLKQRGITAEELLTTEALIMKLELYEDSKVIKEETGKIIDSKQGVGDE